MGVERKILIRGKGPGSPAVGDEVYMNYTGWVYDAKKSKKEFKGKQFDTTAAPKSRGLFKFTIGVGKVIRGWDEGVMQMNVGETARLTITPDYGYDAKVLPGIPAGSTLIFDVELIKIDRKSDLSD